MDSSRKILDAFGFSYFGTYVDAYYAPNENNNIVLKKRPIMPNRKTREINRAFCDNVWDSNYMIKRKPNLWAVDTKRSNITTIDIDQPDKCDILEHLIKKCKFYVKTRKGYHFYFKYNDTIAKKISEFNENKHTALCNTVDFNTDLLFFGGKYNVIDEVYTALNEDGTQKYYTTKKGVKIPIWCDYKLKDESYEYKVIKAEKIVDMDDKIINWCVKIIDIYNKKEQEDINNNPRKKKLFDNVKYDNDKFVNKLDVTTVLNGIKCLSDKRFYNGEKNCYDVWRNTIFICKNMNNSEEVIKALWERSKIGKYKNISYNEVLNHFNNQTLTDVDKSTFFNICRDNFNGNYDKYFTSTYDVPDFKYTEINKQFLDYDELIEYFGSEKLRVIKSRYGSGKTQFITKVIQNAKEEERIIFLVMRRSLALSLANEFKEYGFINYLEAKDGEMTFKTNRVIISLDSLSKVSFRRLQLLNIKAYDTVFCDEFTSLLAHMSFEQMHNPEDIYQILKMIINKSKISYFLDGDISNREIKYLQKYHDYNALPIVNVNKGHKYHFYLHYDEQDFIDKISCDLKNKLNVVVASATSKFAKQLYELFKDDYKSLLIIGETSDKDKKKMTSANDLFKKHQLTVYTSTVSVGVDINEKNHFNKVYGYFSNCQTVCAREFFQMLFRVRNPEDDNINILLANTCVMAPHHKLKHFEDVIHTSFDINDTRAYDYIQLWNRWEEANKCYNLNVFLYYCTIKGHKYTLNEDKVDKFKKIKNDDVDDYYDVEGCDIVINDDGNDDEEEENVDNQALNIYNSELIDDDKYKELTKRVSKFKATTEQKRQIEKFIYYKKFCLPVDISFDDFKKYYRNLHILKSYKMFYMLNNEDDEGYVKVIGDVKLRSRFDTFILTQKHNYFKYITSILGFKKCGDKITKKDLDSKLKDIYKLINTNDFNTIYLCSSIDDKSRSITPRLQMIFNHCGFDFTPKQAKINGVKTYVYTVSESELLKYYNDKYRTDGEKSIEFNKLKIVENILKPVEADEPVKTKTKKTEVKKIEPKIIEQKYFDNLKAFD
jgi:hypothetical protein